VRRRYGVIQVAATYMGAVIGAGFASGQELVQFFLKFREKGYWGLLIAGLLFALLGALSIWVVNKKDVTSYTQLMFSILGKRIGRIMELWLTVFLFAGLCIMLAGSVAVFVEHLSAPFWLGVLVTTACLLIALISGSRGVLIFNSCLMPVLIFVSILVSIMAIGGETLLTNEALQQVPDPKGMVGGNWLVATFLYVSYNMVTGAVVLTSLSRETRESIFGGIIGGLLLGVLGFSITLAMDHYYPQVLAYEIPMLFISRHLHPILEFFYTLILWFAMLTTALANAFGLARRFSGIASYNVAAVVVILLAVPFSRMGFAQLVSNLYPIFGYMGFIIIIGIIRTVYKELNKG